MGVAANGQPCLVDPGLRSGHRRTLTVTSMGTIWPSRMYLLIIAPYVDPGRFCSARRRSPAVLASPAQLLVPRSDPLDTDQRGAQTHSL